MLEKKLKQINKQISESWNDIKQIQGMQNIALLERETERLKKLDAKRVVVQVLINESEKRSNDE